MRVHSFAGARASGSLLAVAALALLAALFASAPATAAPSDDPVDLGGAYVLDRAGVLGGDTSDVRASVDRLFEQRGVQLFVVYVDEFSGTSSDQDWANETAITSGLGSRDILLAIAVDERVFRYSVAEDFPLSNQQIDQIAIEGLAPALREGTDDWSGGAVAFADGLSAALAPSPVPYVIGGVVVAGVGTVVIAGAVRRRRANKKLLDAAAADIKTLELRAGTLLVELDDALKTSEQELGFAQAQFGDDEIKDFTAAIAEAKGIAKQAFEIQHKLDDAFPETPEQHRAMTLQVIELAERADATLDAQADSFDKLRRLDENAPQVLEEIAKEQAGLADRIAAADDTLGRLAAQYPKADIAHLTDVPAQARKLTGFAETAVEKARAELARPKGDAAVAVRAAQQAVGQVGQLLASVETADKDLAEQAELRKRAAAEFEQQIQRARSQVSAAQDYITTHRGAVGAGARTRISEAARHLDAALTLAVSDPTQALDEARQADNLAVAAIQSARSDVADYERTTAVQQHVDEPAYQQADSAGLGGILNDLFFGSGSRPSRPSSGGWSWGGSSGSGGWSSSRPGSFGGSSRGRGGGSRPSRPSSGRRGGGGRF
jgi:hypothetical protein